jgi:hypothetical protein
MGINAPVGLSSSGLPALGDAANGVVTGVISAVGPQPPFTFRGPMNLALWASINTSLTTTAGSLSSTVSSATGLAAGDAINSANLPGGSTIGVLSGTTVTLALSPRTYFGNISSNGRITGYFPTDRILGATVTTESNAGGVTLPAGTTVTAIIQAEIAPTGTSPGQPAIVQLSANPTLIPADSLPLTPFLMALTGNGVVATGADTTAVFTGAAVTFSATVQLERSFDGGKTFLVCNIGATGTLAQWTGTTVGPINITFGEPEKNVLYRFNCTAYASGTINYRISQTGGAAESLAIGPLSSG